MRIDIPHELPRRREPEAGPAPQPFGPSPLDREREQLPPRGPSQARQRRGDFQRAPVAEIGRHWNGPAAVRFRRQGWVRMSPHFYISPEEIDRVVEALP